jgi:hypothetical protein
MFFRFFFFEVIKTFALPALAIIVVLSLVVAGISALAGGSAFAAFLWTAGIGAVIALVAAIAKAMNPGSFS